MFVGEFTHTLDSKRRLSLPAQFRRDLGGKVVLTRGLDTCVFGYPHEEWKRMTQKLNEMSLGQKQSRSLNRFLLAGAIEADIDSSGRVLVPQFLADFADLGEKIVLAGVGTRFEVWDAESWEEHKASIEAEADDLAEQLGNLGMI